MNHGRVQQLAVQLGDVMTARRAFGVLSRLVMIVAQRRQRKVSVAFRRWHAATVQSSAYQHQQSAASWRAKYTYVCFMQCVQYLLYCMSRGSSPTLTFTCCREMKALFSQLSVRTEAAEAGLLAAERAVHEVCVKAVECVP